MSDATTRPPKLPPAWFKHSFWRGHRALCRLSRGRFLWTAASKRGWGALRLTTVGQESGKERMDIVGYFEEEAVISYTHYLAEIDEGRSPNVPAPEIAKRYWGLPANASLRDVVLVVRADEAHHRDVNHGFANELAGLPSNSVAPCPSHEEQQPKWKQAA